MSQITFGAPGQPTVLEAQAEHASIPGGVSADAKPANNDSLLQHDTYFFKDGNITFLVRVTLLYDT